LIVFISHAQQDVEPLEKLKHALNAEGVEYYVAEDDSQPGKVLSSKIVGAIKGSHVMIALMTENGARSPTVNQEIGIAINSGMRVIPLVEKGVNVGPFIDELEQFRFDHEELSEECASVASFLSKLALSSQTRKDPLLMRVSADFTRCRNYSILFHNSDPFSVRELVIRKCSAFVENPLLHYPLMFRPQNSRSDSSALLRRLQHDLRNAPEGECEQLLGDYVAHLCEIDAAIVAHLEIRKAHATVRYRERFANVVDAYYRRLDHLYYHEVPFGRTNMGIFFRDGVIVWLINADETDAIDYISSYLTAELWAQLNLNHGWFDSEEEQARSKADKRQRILNKACQKKRPIKQLDWRHDPASERGEQPAMS
jgi:hypothetical protein